MTLELTATIEREGKTLKARLVPATVPGTRRKGTAWTEFSADGSGGPGENLLPKPYHFVGTAIDAALGIGATIT